MNAFQVPGVLTGSERRRRTARGGKCRCRGRKCRQPRLESLETRTLLAGDTLLITELMASNDAALADGDGAYPDWVEIHNPTSSPVNLDGWHLTDDPTQLDRWPLPAVSLDTGQYLVLFASGQSTDDYVDAGGNFHANFKLAAGGESVLLVDATETVVHGYVDYPPQTADVSYGLKSDLVTESFFTSPTPGGPAGDAAADVVISEIMYHPTSPDGVEDLKEEYIELSNRGSEPVTLAGWRLSDGVDFVFPDVTLPADGILAVAADVATFSVGYPRVANVVGGWTGRLSNSGEPIELVDASGRVIDTVRYADSGAWAQRRRDPEDSRGWIWQALHDGEGASLELVNLDLTNDVADNWLTSAAVGGTPGRANSVAAADIAPAIFDVTQAPIVPKSTDQVTLSARLLDEDPGGVTAALFWRVSTTIPNPFVEIPMLDDGRHGDGAAGDGVYAAT
ncbi:MAG: lamin tail domain-containing protein, partial [Pirellulales bacterium]